MSPGESASLVLISGEMALIISFVSRLNLVIYWLILHAGFDDAKTEEQRGIGEELGQNGAVLRHGRFG